MRWALIGLLAAGCVSSGGYNEPVHMGERMADLRPARYPDPEPVCNDARTGDAINVSCAIGGGSLTEYSIGFLVRASMKRAAVATLAAGKTHMMPTGSPDFRNVTRTDTTPVRCEPRPLSSGQRFGLALQAMGNGMQSGQAHTNCTNYGYGSTNCTTTYQPPPPPPRMPAQPIDCTGGDSVATVLGVTLLQGWEAMTAEEAAARASPQLPVDRRPLDARAYLELVSPSKPPARGDLVSKPVRQIADVADPF